MVREIVTQIQSIQKKSASTIRLISFSGPSPCLALTHEADKVFIFTIP